MRNPWGDRQEWRGTWKDGAREWGFIPDEVRGHNWTKVWIHTWRTRKKSGWVSTLTMTESGGCLIGWQLQIYLGFTQVIWCKVSNTPKPNYQRFPPNLPEILRPTLTSLRCAVSPPKVLGIVKRMTVLEDGASPPGMVSLNKLLRCIWVFDELDGMFLWPS